MITKNADELKNCNIIKTLMMFSVVLYHSMALWNKNTWLIPPKEENIVLMTVALFLNNLHIYVFTFVSGYLFYYLKFDIHRYKKFSADLKKRSQRLLIPYISGALFWCVWFSLWLDNSSVIDLLKKYALGINPSQLWFLLMLFVVFVIFYVLSEVFNKLNFFWGFAICMVFFALSYVSARFIPNVYQHQTAMKYIVFYYLGFCFRRNEKLFLRKIPIFVLIVLETILFSAYILSDWYFDLHGFKTPMLIVIGFLLHITGCVLVFNAFNHLRVKFEKGINRIENNLVFKWFSENSMLIYIFHQQIIFVVDINLNGLLHPVIIVLINIIAAITFSGVLATLLTKWKITRFLFTGIYKKG